MKVEGKIVYIPSETILVNSNDRSLVTEFERLKKPKTALMVSVLPTGPYRCKIYLDGTYWYVEEGKVFPVRKKCY